MSALSKDGQAVLEPIPAEIPKESGNSEPGNAVAQEFRTLLRQSSHYLFGLVSTLALGFISFPLFTRMFSVADYGLIDLAQKVLLLAAAFGKAGMQNSTFRFYNREAFAADPNAEKSYYSTMFFGVAGVAILVTLLFALFVKFSPDALVDGPLAAILLFASILILVRCTQSIVQAFMRIQERTQAYNVSGFVIKAVTIVAIVALIPLMGRSVKTYYSGTMIAEIGVTLVLCYPLFRTGFLRIGNFDRALFVSGLSFGVPLIIQELAGIVLDSGDRALVRIYMGADALGYYSVAYGLASYVNTLMMVPLGLAILPIYMRLWRTEGREKTIEFLSTSLNTFLLFAAGLFAVAAVSSHDAVVLMASSKYGPAAPLIPTLVAGLLIYAVQVFLNAGLLIQKKTADLALTLAFSAVLNVGLNCLLLPKMGLQGAAVATLISYAVCTLILAQRAFKVLPLDIPLKSLFVYLAAAGIVWTVVPLLELHSAFWNLAVKSSLSAILYGGLILLADRPARNMASTLWSKLPRRTK